MSETSLSTVVDDNNIIQSLPSRISQVEFHSTLKEMNKNKITVQCSAVNARIEMLGQSDCTVQERY